ncbi:MAG: dUTP diphosphatase [Campylobacterota bacterium]|nr:dUTP diphosphatase [Campylobacterota bacterium]
MLYEELKTTVKDLGFITIESFANYIGVTPSDILTWEERDEVPYTVTLIVHLLQGEQNLPNEANSLDLLVEECLPLAALLEESSSFPHKLEEMFLLQKRLNDDTNGTNWELGINKFDKEINWLRCIHMEVSELIDSTPWKHWKNISEAPDLNNIHVELVDVWHFLMSYILQETNIPKAVSLVNTHCIYEAVEIEDIDPKLIVKEAEKLSYIAFAIETGNMPAFSGVERFIDQFFRCCKLSGLSFTWLQKIYIGKNCLNKFRQDNGYKEGTYIKVWNKKEDNVVMLDILEEIEDLTFDIVYDKLQEIYSKLGKTTKYDNQ